MAYHFISRMDVVRKAADGTRLPLERFCRSSDPDDAATLLRTPGHTLVEYLSGVAGEARRSKLYFDADDSIDTATTDVASAEMNYMTEVVRRMDTYMDRFRPYLPDVSYVVATRHGPHPTKPGWHKLSIRAFVQGIAIHHHECRNFMEGIDPDDINDDSIRDGTCLWDMSVYKQTEQTMCAINGKKAGGKKGAATDERVLMPVCREHLDDSRILLYVIQHVEPGWTEVDASDASNASNASRARVTPNTPNTNEANMYECDDIDGLVRCIGRVTADDRSSWIRVGIVLKALGGDQRYFAPWLAFSRRGARSFDSEEDCRKTWASLNASAPGGSSGTRCLTIGTLRWYANRDDPVAYAEWRRRDVAEAAHMPASISSPEWDTKYVVRAAADATGSTRIEVDARIDGSDVLFSADDREYRVRLSTLGVTSAVHDTPRYIHGQPPGLACGPIVIPNTSAPAQGWTVTRPSQHRVVLRNDGTPRTDVELDMEGESVRRVTVTHPDSNKKVTLRNSKALLVMMENACRDAIRLHLQGSLHVPVNVINTVVFNNCSFSGCVVGELERRTPDFAFLTILESAGFIQNMVAINEKDVYVFDTQSGLWVLGSLNEAAVPIRESACSGALKDVLSDVDAAYLQSCDGPVKVLKSIITKFKNAAFADRLNQLPNGCVAFDDGLLDAATGEIRPFCRDDYVALTIGYKYEAPDDATGLATFVARFYEQVFPVPEEREYFQRVIAKALFGNEQAKHFLVLTDERDGSNGKTTLMRAVEAVFGRLHAPAERDFLYESSNTNPNGASANLLSFIDKRLAFFDEPSKDDGNKRLDIRRIKDLSSGDSRIRGRALQANTMQDACWRALIVIACNESNFPKIDATDRPLMKRMKAVKMRGLFVGEKELTERLSEEDEHVFLLEENGLKERLKVDGRMAHMHVLIRAYQRLKRDHGVLTEPACIAEMIDKIVESSDPRIPKAAEFVDLRIDFKPHRTPEFAGKKYFAWIPEKELLAAFWTWYRDYDQEDNREFARTIDAKNNIKSAWKAVLKTVMQAKGRAMRSIRPVIGVCQTSVNAYDMVSWKVV